MVKQHKKDQRYVEQQEERHHEQEGKKVLI